MEDLVGKKMYGFEFKDGPGFPHSMRYFVGKEGEILKHYSDVCTVSFDEGGLWSYPYPEILDHLVEEEKTIDQIINEVKQLTSQI